MKNWSSVFIFLLLFVVILSGCSGAAQVSPTTAPTATTDVLKLTDGLGRTIQFDQPATKIISIAPSNTEILFAIGAGDQVIARDEFSDYPDAAKQLASVGGGFGAFDMEKMVSLQPDLVLASELTPAEQVDAIEQLGLKVFLLSNPQDIDTMYQNLEIAGKITGKTAEAESLVDALKKRTNAVDNALAEITDKPVVFYELDSTDPNAPWTAGPGSFIGSLIDRAGGVNLGEKLQDAYAQISIEQLLVDQPNIVLVGDYTWGGVTAEDVMARSSWMGLEAVKQGKVYIFDDNLVSRPGPRMVDGLETMAKLLHPELFK